VVGSCEHGMESSVSLRRNSTSYRTINFAQKLFDAVQRQSSTVVPVHSKQA